MNLSEVPTLKNVRKGTILIHPHHGVMRVTRIHVTERMDGKKAKHADMKQVVDHDAGDGSAGPLLLTVPVELMAAVGLRRPVDPEEAEEVLELLSEPPNHPDPTTWARMMQNCEKRLAEGDLFSAARVIRSLHRRRTKRIQPPSAAERAMMLRAKRVVASEIAAARSIIFSKAEEQIDSSLEAMSEKLVGGKSG